MSRGRLHRPERIISFPPLLIAEQAPAMTTRPCLKQIFLAGLCVAACCAFAAEPEKVQRFKVPSPPWPAGDERGMGNQIGPATFQRCAWHMAQPGAKSYELSQLRSNTMPLSPFS